MNITHCALVDRELGCDLALKKNILQRTDFVHLGFGQFVSTLPLPTGYRPVDELVGFVLDLRLPTQMIWCDTAVIALTATVSGFMFWSKYMPP